MIWDEALGISHHQQAHSQMTLSSSLMDKASLVTGGRLLMQNLESGRQKSPPLAD